MHVAEKITIKSWRPTFGVVMPIRNIPGNEMLVARDGVPASRDRIVELIMAVCIIGVLHGLYVMNHYAVPGKARMIAAFEGKNADEMKLREILAVEGNWGNANNSEIVSLVDMKNGKVAGLKFFVTSDPLYVVNWECRQATVQEIMHAKKSLPENSLLDKSLPDKSAKIFKDLEAVELTAEYGFKVCKKGGAGAQ